MPGPFGILHGDHAAPAVARRSPAPPLHDDGRADLHRNEVRVVVAGPKLVNAVIAEGEAFGNTGGTVTVDRGRCTIPASVTGMRKGDDVLACGVVRGEGAVI